MIIFLRSDVISRSSTTATLHLYQSVWQMSHPTACGSLPVKFCGVRGETSAIPRNTVLTSSDCASGASIRVSHVWSLRTSLCPIIILSAGASMYGLIPKFKSLVIASVEVLVWTVASTRCPVNAALKAISAVSALRISQTIIISGSWRNTDLSHSSNVYHFVVLICDCSIPGSSYSTGSSNVIIFFHGWFR